MVQYQLKLRTTQAQDAVLREWLWCGTGIWNWANQKFKNDDTLTAIDLSNQTKGHATKIGFPAGAFQSLLANVFGSWERHRTGVSKAPHLKGARRKLNSIPFKDPIKLHVGNQVMIPVLGRIRYHKQVLPQGKIKCGRLILRASGWYLCLFIDTFRNRIEANGVRQAVGIDPGFNSLLTLSNGEKIRHPRELEASAGQLAKTQRGNGKKKTARLHERIANQRKNRNHKLSLKLVQRFSTIYFSKDNIKGIANKFGKSVSSSNHYQLRNMLAYKSLAGGTEYIEVDSRNSTRTCSSCGASTGPAGLAGLKVRSWVCSACGSQHDRDVNAAINTLNFGVGRTLEMRAA